MPPIPDPTKQQLPGYPTDPRPASYAPPPPVPEARGPSTLIASPIESQQSFYSLLSGILRNASLAYRLDRVQQENMRSDPAIMGPLISLAMKVAATEWSLEPADPYDSDQKRVADFLTDLLRDTPMLTDLLVNQCDALWYGPAAVNFQLDYDARGRAKIVSWMPIHPDSLVWTEFGQLGQKVGPRYTIKPTGYKLTTPGWDGPVHLFNDWERRAILLTVFRPTAPSYREPYQAAYAYSGRGMRDVVWYYWQIKQAVLQNWTYYTQRYGMGIRKAFYQYGNKESQDAMATAAANVLGDTTLLIPDDPTQPRRANDIEVMDPSGTNAEAFGNLIDRLEAKIKECIVGQVATSEAANTGLGSTVATEHARTKADHVHYLCARIAESFNTDLIPTLTRLNFGVSAIPPRFRFSPARPEPEKFMGAIERVVDLGGAVVRSDVYRNLGLREPTANDRVLTRQSVPLIDGLELPEDTDALPELEASGAGP